MTQVATKALWTWDTTNPLRPVATRFDGSPTKTGILPGDLRDFVGVPIQLYHTSPPTPIDDLKLMAWIRQAEDWVEQQAGLLLTPTWIASPPANTAESARSSYLSPTSSDGAQHLGVDYDLEDAAYDFQFERAQDNGWMIQSLRYRPLRIVDGGQKAIKNMAYVYPLLNQYFQISPTWFVEDRDFAQVRLVPSANMQMLPLFALQLSVQGFGDSVPGAIAVQYTAGLTANDYNTRFSFIPQLVLAQAAITALRTIQGTVNMGAESTSTLVDGVQYQQKFNVKGPFGNLIDQWTSLRDDLMATAVSQVAGPVFITV